MKEAIEFINNSISSIDFKINEFEVRLQRLLDESNSLHAHIERLTAQRNGLQNTLELIKKEKMKK